MQNNPLFSVIIPTYNRAERLKTALNSLVNQTFKDFEVLVCDDGSTDNSKETTESFDKMLNIRYLWEENWGGGAQPRNNGIKASLGDWICFLDSDDFWYPDKLETCKEYIKEYDLIYHDLRIYSNAGKENQIIKSRKLKKNVFVDLIVNRNAISNSSVIAKKEIIIKAGMLAEDKNLIAIEDYDLWLRIAQLTNKFYYIEKELGGYFQNNKDNISTNYKNRYDIELYIFNKFQHFIPETLLTKALINLNIQLAIYNIRSNNIMFRKNLFYIISQAPITRKLWALFYLLLGKFYLKNFNN